MSLRPTIILSLVFVLSGHINAAAQDSFPFLAEVVQNGVNIRAGGNQNFERLAQVDQGQELVVVDKNFTWYKVELPSSAAVYISDKYLTKLNKSEGKVTADKVNVRAGPTINFSVVGQLSSGMIVTILDYKDNWYKIQPSQLTYGWVQDSFVRFKAALPPRVAPVAVATVVAPTGPQAPVAPVVTAAAVAAPSVPPKHARIEGELIAQKAAGGQMVYSIVNPPEAPTVIKGLSNSLEPFVGFRILAEGMLQPGEGPNAPSLLNVSKIQLIL